MGVPVTRSVLRLVVVAAFAYSCQGRKRLGGGRSLEMDSWPRWAEPISWQPRAMLFHNFISDEEADHVVALAKPFIRPSTVGGKVKPSYRNSYGTFVRRLQDPIIARVEQRLAEWTHLNISYQEELQILRYGKGQRYGAHHDSLSGDSPRMATVILYLNDAEEGGETAFTQGSQWVDPSLPARLGPFSPCAQGHVAARPRKGDALLFYSLRPDGQEDPTAMHTGCPVLRGVKWVATKWFHSMPVRPEEVLAGSGRKNDRPVVYPEDCLDTHPSCETWAKAGECEGRNKAFMVGDLRSLGSCRLSCATCEVCRPDDVACKSRNRVKAGYLSLEELELL